MARPKWRRKDFQAAKEAVAAYNKARTKWVRSHKGSAAYVPPRIKYDDISFRQFADRAEFNRWLRGLQSATKPEAFKPQFSKSGEVATRWEVENARYELQSVKAKLRGLKQRSVKRGKPKETEARLRFIEENIIVRDRSFQKMKLGELARYTRALQLAGQDIRNISQLDEDYKQSYLKAMRQQLNLGEGDKLYDLVSSLPADEISTAMYLDPMLHIDEVYLTEIMEEEITGVAAHWYKYVGRAIPDEYDV